jgi:hypothetical protein
MPHKQNPYTQINQLAVTSNILSHPVIHLCDICSCSIMIKTFIGARDSPVSFNVQVPSEYRSHRWFARDKENISVTLWFSEQVTQPTNVSLANTCVKHKAVWKNGLRDLKNSKGSRKLHATSMGILFCGADQECYCDLCLHTVHQGTWISYKDAGMSLLHYSPSPNFLQRQPSPVGWLYYCLYSFQMVSTFKTLVL